MKNIEKLLRQQAAIAEFGSFAFGEKELSKILDRACKLCAELLGVEYSKICEYRTAKKHLIVVAGYGWRDGVIGYIYANTDRESPQVCAFESLQPVITTAKDLKSFALPRFYADHGVISTLDVVIKGKHGPFGVLEIDSMSKHEFDVYDIAFLTSFSNILAEAINSAKKTQSLRNTIKKRDQLIREKNELIEQKTLLAAEVHHRVRNNLQIIHGMLVSRIGELGADQDASHVTLRKIASRVMAMAHVYDQLLVSGGEQGISVSTYLDALIVEIVEIYGALRPGVVLTKALEDIELNLDRASVLGLITTELVTNAYMHAFPDGAGEIEISLKKAPGQRAALLTVQDNGIGFDELKQSKRTGVKLVKMLVRQIEGDIKISTKSGASFIVDIPL